MKRRDFIKSSIAISALGSCFPSALLGSKNRFSFKNSNIDSDKIVILIKMNGGNDGLNTVIPFQNSSYYEYRPSVSIPIEQSIPITDNLALHPALNNWQELFFQQKMGIIQGVGYPNGNMSHFRSSDIWDTGSDENIELETGWLGRLLELEYPNFPDNAPDHPLAIQYNSANLLEFKTNASNAGLYLYDPDTIHSIITGNYIENINSEVPETYGGDELAFIKELDYMSFNYSNIIFDASQNAPNTIHTYPETPIGKQFEITSRLISGGLSTPFYRLYQNGYDTHGNQLERHYQLLLELSNALNVFINEMESIGLLDRILIVTTTEFGRRVFENASGGTDHGTSAPVFVFGSNILGGVLGDDPEINKLDDNNNLPFQYDFRQIYSSIIINWFGLNSSISNSVFNGTFNPVPFINLPLSSKNKISPKSIKIYPAHPNPFNANTTLRYSLPKKALVKITIYDMLGNIIKNLVNENQNSGNQSVRWDATNNKGQSVSTGTYLYTIETGKFKQTKKMILLK